MLSRYMSTTQVFSRPARTSFWLALLALSTSIFTPAAFAVSAVTAEECAALIEHTEGKGFQYTVEAIKLAKRFADEHQLPHRIVEFGPPERRIKRLIVGVDFTDPVQFKAYLDQFNLNTPVKEKGSGSLVLEFQHEPRAVLEDGSSNGYITGVLRTEADRERPIYRWGREDYKHSQWWTSLLDTQRAPIVGYGHAIGLSASEVKNVRTFLKNPGARGKCKSDNCVAWTSSIELGQTAVGASDEERKYLFTTLGMGRSIAHFEIGRRLFHAANDRHGIIFVFYRGQAGLEAFEDSLQVLPPEPRIPYINVIKGLGLDPKSPAMTAIKSIPTGSNVFFPIAAGASPEGYTALVQHASTTQDGMDIHLMVNGISESAIQSSVSGSGNLVRLHALFLGGNMRKAYSQGKIAYIPGYLGDFPKYVAEGKPGFQYDAMVVRVSPPNEQGQYSLGPNNDMILSILEARPKIKVIAEVNPNVPFTHGENFLTDAQITAKFNSDTELAGPPVVPVTQVESDIGQLLASLIDSNSTLQVGIGNIFGGLPAGLKRMGRSNIQVFSEMFSDPLMEAMKDGTVTRAETGFAYGSSNLYRWLDRNEKVTFIRTSEVNNPAAVSAKPKFHAINTALQVNLTGEVNATIGPDGKRISSPGGQVEFMSGASRSPNGKSIIALRSTAKNGTISTITLDLYPGPVTTPHEYVSHVVTEHGVAHLAGKSERERALALIKIADPKFQPSLLDEAKKRGIVRANDTLY